MAILVVITQRTGADGGQSVSLDGAAAHRLAEIGVTNVAVVADDSTEAVVLEGWAFDTVASGAEAASILVGDRDRRALQPVLQTLLARPADLPSEIGEPT